MANRPTGYRDLESRSLIDVGARSTPSGAANAAQQLADTFSAWSRTAADVGGLAQRFAAQKASTAGTAAGLAGKPEFKPGVTAVGRAYNSAAETGYVAQAQTDIDDTMTRLEMESEADEEAFVSKAKAYSDALMAEVPEEMRPAIGHVLTARSNAGGHRIRGQQMAKERTQTHANYLSSIPAIVRNTIATAQELPPEEADEALLLSVSDNQARLDALVDHNIIAADDAVVLHARFKDALDAGFSAALTAPAIEELMNLAREDVQMGDLALAAIQGREDLSPEQKVDIRKGYEQQRNQLAFERSRQFVEHSGDLAKRLAGGTFGAEIEAENLALYQNAAISVDEYQSNQATIARNAKQTGEDEVDVAAVLAAMSGGRGLDPTNTQQRNALDKLFQAEAQAAGMEVGDARWQARAVQLAERTNMLPASAQSWARVNMLSGDPIQVAEGASFFARAQDANSAAWDYDADPKIAAFAGQINDNLAAGVKTERALEMARKNVYEMTEHERAIVTQRYRDDKVVLGNADALASALSANKDFDPGVFGGAFHSVPAPSLSMQAEYNNTVERMYNFTNGDIEKARQLAFDSIKSRYGHTRMNGEAQIVKYPPEKMYGIPPDVLRADVASTATAVGYTGDAAAIRLTPVPATGRTKGKVWLMQLLDEYGYPDTVRDQKNEPVLYKLPLGDTFTATRNRLNQAKLDEAAAKRATILSEPGTPYATGTIDRSGK